MGKQRVDILHGDCISKLRELPEKSIHCVVTSPPYWGLRSYGGDAGMIGLEPTFEEHLDNLVAVFREVHRVLRDDGTLWLNYGDAYVGGGRGKGKGGSGPKSGKQVTNKGSYGNMVIKQNPYGLAPKNIIGMPWRVAFALQAEGWILRCPIVWHKKNPMPESTQDRPTSAYEMLFLFTKEGRYFYDNEAFRTTFSELTKDTKPLPRGGRRAHPHETGKYASKYNVPKGWASNSEYEGQDARFPVRDKPTYNRNRKRFPTDEVNGIRNRETYDSLDEAGKAAYGANLRNVWSISIQGFKEAHFATFPFELAERCIKLGTSEKGVCPECGKSWERTSEKEFVNRGGNEVGDVYRKGESGEETKSRDRAFGLASRGAKVPGGYSVQTIGWRPTCNCYDDLYREFPKPNKKRKRLQRDSYGNRWKRVKARPGLDSWAVIPATVLDPFGGAGTTALVAVRHGRNAVLIEINQKYVDMSYKRIRKSKAPMLLDVNKK